MNGKARRAIGKTATYVTLVIIILVLNLPFLSMLGTALKPSKDAMTVELFPSNPTFENFVNIFTNTNFPRYLLNSFIVEIVAMVLCTVFAATAGYVIARKSTFFFRSYGVTLLLLQMFPTILLLLPLFLIFKNLGLVNTIYALIITYTAMNLPFSIWLVRSFFSTIPTDLEEAARIDGCSQFKTFYKIILPLALPGLATVAIFTFVNSWNDYLMASLFLRSDDIYTLTVGLHSFINQHSFQWSNLMSASTVSVLPTVLFLVIAQKYLIQGLSAGATKG